MTVVLGASSVNTLLRLKGSSDFELLCDCVFLIRLDQELLHHLVHQVMLVHLDRS
jgi:hypothetical protein